MKIYTRGGDDGSTGLFGGKRTRKSDPRLHAEGSVDELNACLGLARAERTVPPALHTQIHELQQLLFVLGADLATPLDAHVTPPRMEARHSEMLERWIDEWESRLTPITNFIIPGGTAGASHLHLARTVCRRAERWVATLADADRINPETQVFLNRLSDFLFVAARACNAHQGIPDVTVEPRKEAQKRS